MTFEYTSKEFTASAKANIREGMRQVDIYGLSVNDSGQRKRFIGYYHLEVHPHLDA